MPSGPHALVLSEATIHSVVGVGMHRDQQIVVEGRPPVASGRDICSPLGPGSVLVRAGPLCGKLVPGPQEVCALGVLPGHGLQCGSLGGVVGDRRLIEDVDAGVGFCRCRLLGIGSCGGGACPARPLSGIEEVND